MSQHRPEHALPDEDTSPAAEGRPNHPPQASDEAPLAAGVWQEEPRDAERAAGPSSTPDRPGTDTRPEPDGPTTDLVLSARGLQFASREGTVFGPVDLDLPRGSVGVVAGQQGSGRSAVLLALAGRLKGVTGSLQAGGVDGIANPRALRKQTSVARITGLADLEPNLTVAESRDERAIADGMGQRRGRERFDHLEELLGHHFAREERIERLPAIERTLLCLVLGALVPSRYLVLDDIEASLTESQLAAVYAAIDRLTQDGATVIVSALEQDAVPANAAVWHLAAPQPDEPELLPDVAPPRPARAAEPTLVQTPANGHPMAREDA